MLLSERFEVKRPPQRSAPIILDDLPTDIDKDVIDINTPSRGGFEVGSVAPLLGQLEDSLAGDLPVVLKVGLVANDDEGDVFVFFYAHDHVAEFGEFAQAVHVGDGEDEEEALALLHVELAHRGELLGACCVEA